MNPKLCAGFEVRTISNLIKRNVDHLEEETYGENITSANRFMMLHLAHHRDRDRFQRNLESESEI